MQFLKNIFVRNWLGLLLCLIVCVLLFQQCQENSRLVSNFSALQTKNTTYKNKFGTLTTKVATLELTNSELKKVLPDTVYQLTKPFTAVKNITTIKTVTKFDTIKIVFKEPIPCSFVRDSSTVKEWYSFNYRIDSTGLLIKNLQIPNEQIVITGTQRKWFLGKQTLITEITNTNANIIIIGAKNYQTTIKPNWIERIIYFGLGALTAKAITL